MDLLGESGRILTAGLAKELAVALNQPNRTPYEHLTYQRLTDPDEITWYRHQSQTGQTWQGRFVEPNIVQRARSPRGQAAGRARRFKRWLASNHGARIVYDLV